MLNANRMRIVSVLDLEVAEKTLATAAETGMTQILWAAAPDLQHGGENAAIGGKMLIVENVMRLAKVIKYMIVKRVVKIQ